MIKILPGKFKGYKNQVCHLRGMKFLGQKIRGMKFFRTKIRGTKISVLLQKYAPTGYPGLKKTAPYVMLFLDMQDILF